MIIFVVNAGRRVEAGEEQLNRMTASCLSGSCLHRRSFASLARHPIEESAGEQWLVTRLASL